MPSANSTDIDSPAMRHAGRDALSLALMTTALGGQAAARQAVATKTDYYVVNFSPNGAQFIDVAGMQIKGSDAMYWTTVVMPAAALMSTRRRYSSGDT